jgi:7,8-dihydropterin-6-yl-methyl-4-(beta-D-ribofuranosyl)aminobenzene 5'-phosphate synthase
MAQQKAQAIRTVHKLTITFLVDNSIEWMTKLPPGFTQEVVLHLQQDAIPPDEVTGVPVLDFDKFCCGT